MSSNAFAVIPARAGSKRLPGKNMMRFRGKPLIWYSIRAARLCSGIDQIFVSSNDQEALACAREEGVECIERPEELASDTASTFDVLRHAATHWQAKGADPEFLVLLQPTSPLRRRHLIDEGLKRLIEDADATSVTSVCESRLFTGEIDNGIWRPDFAEDTRSQDIPAKYVPSGSLFIYRCRKTIQQGSALGDRPLALIEDGMTTVNIDTVEDSQRLEIVARHNSEIFDHLLDP